LAGCAALSLVKYRFYISMPVLTYKCVTGTFGVAILGGFVLEWLRRRHSRMLYLAGVAGAWCLALAGFVTHHRDEVAGAHAYGRLRGGRCQAVPALVGARGVRTGKEERRPRAGSASMAAERRDRGRRPRVAVWLLALLPTVLCLVIGIGVVGYWTIPAQPQ